MRLTRSHIAALALLCIASMGASCDRAGSTEPAASAASEGTPTSGGARSGDGAERIEKLDGVDTSELTDHEVDTWAGLVNEQLSPCGEPMSVAKCVAQKHGCRSCLPAARYLTRLVLEGYDKATIEQHFTRRFKAGEKREFTIDAAKVFGSPMAPVTIVEFSDFQCPHCAAANPELHRVVREHEGKVKLVFKHYPLPSHTRAVPAARAAEAAARQGKFWEMTDLLFTRQRALEDSDLEKYAEQIGLDMERFRADYASPAVAAAVDNDRAEGEKVNVEGTPTVYVNGRKLEEPFKVLPAYIKEELEL
jgi:predicted DsbA family dithiol-disulfide isomerase